MTSEPAPFAAGVHLPWAEVPRHVQEWVAGVAGGEPERVRDLSGGFSPGAAALLSCPGGDLFVKAVGLALNPNSPGMHRREAVISSALPTSRCSPACWTAMTMAIGSAWRSAPSTGVCPDTPGIRPSCAP